MGKAGSILWFFLSSLLLLKSSSAFSADKGGTWKPRISAEERQYLKTQAYESETIGSIGFHHIEFYCGDAKSTANQFASALGMSVVGVSGQGTGNDKCVSYGLASGDFQLLITAPYSRAVVSEGVAGGGGGQVQYDAPDPLPGFDLDLAHDFFSRHGLAARAVGLLVKDSSAAFQASVKNGATAVLHPTFVPTCEGQAKKGFDSGGCYISEVKLYGDVVLRYVSFPNQEQKMASQSSLSKAPFLPHLTPLMGKSDNFGIYKIDHAVGNVHNLLEAHNEIKKFTGFHEFAEFTSDDVGTVDSGLNSVVLASDSEDVLLPLNEPTKGLRKSQILTFLEQNEGPGLQHLALRTTDIFSTVRKMKKMQGSLFGFELMRQPSEEYYRELPERLGDQLTTAQYKELEKLGILADADDEGILLQLFTRPIGDRPTFFIEIIQRIGCRIAKEGSDDWIERPGCGGFGQGNFRELFKSIEEHEKTLKV